MAVNIAPGARHSLFLDPAVDKALGLIRDQG